MRQPGRKSAASKLVHLAATSTKSRPSAPECLTTAERTTFNKLTLANRHLTVTDAPILTSYVQAMTISHRLGASERDSDYARWERSTKVMLMLARSLRLTVNSTTHPDKLGRVRNEATVDPVDQFFAENPDDEETETETDAENS